MWIKENMFGTSDFSFSHDVFIRNISFVWLNTGLFMVKVFYFDTCASNI